MPPESKMPWFDDICVGPLAGPSRLTQADALLHNRRAYRHLAEVCRRWKIELIHSHAFHRSLFTAAHIQGIPLIATTHGDAANKRYQKQRVINAYRRIAPRVSAVTVLHKGMEACIRRNFGDLFRITIIPNGLDDAWLQPAAPRERDLFLSVGRLGEDKRPGLAIEAYAASTSRRHYGLALAGDGAMKDDLVELARARGLTVAESLPQQAVADTVFFCDYQTGTTLRDLYARSRLLLHPSSTEAFCLVLMEAMASGALPLCDDLDTYKSQFAGSTCQPVFVDTPSPGPWGAAIDAWADSPRLPGLLEANRAGVAGFAWSTVFPLYWQCYEDALASQPIR